MPTYGDSPYLLNALDSALAQETSFPYEIILLLQQVPENLKCELKKYSDMYEYIRVIEMPSPSVTKASNFGIEHSRYSHIARLDNDDVIQPNRIELQLKQFINDNTLVLVGSSARRINEKGEVTGRIKYLNGKFMVKFFARYTCVIPHSSAMFSREAALAVGGYNEKYEAGGDDFNLWSRLIERGNIFIIRDQLLSYRIHPGQITFIRTPEQILNDANTILGKIRKDYSKTLLNLTVEFLDVKNKKYASLKKLSIYFKTILRLPDLFFAKIIYKFLIFVENLSK
jgi:glycosyltransferase involved in cell wall biosynthesis